MTANIDMETDQKVEVLRIPYRGVLREDGKVLVRMKPVEKNDPEKREVKLGLRGSFGFVEVLEGLKEGEEVITFERR